MLEDIRQLKTLRKNLQLTQKELAQHARVSQSLIAKIESGQLDPAYSKFRQILNTLRSLSSSSQKKATDVMEKSIKKLSPENTIQQAITRMKKYNISQIPVFDKNQVVGLVSDTVMLDALAEGLTVATKISKVMTEAPPTISGTADISLVTQILKQYPLIVVFDKGRASGIITKADLFNMLR